MILKRAHIFYNAQIMRVCKKILDYGNMDFIFLSYIKIHCKLFEKYDLYYYSAIFLIQTVFVLEL